MARYTEVLYQKGVRAFKRLHGYKYRPGEFGHQRWLDGWIVGHAAGVRKQRSADNGTE